MQNLKNELDFVLLEDRLEMVNITATSPTVQACQGNSKCQTKLKKGNDHFENTKWSFLVKNIHMKKLKEELDFVLLEDRLEMVNISEAFPTVEACAGGNSKCNNGRC